MKVVYYVLPSKIGSHVFVSESITGGEDVELAILLSKEDEGRPYFDIRFDPSNGDIDVDPSDETEPSFYYEDDILYATLPLRNSNEGKRWAEFLHEKNDEIYQVYGT